MLDDTSETPDPLANEPSVGPLQPEYLEEPVYDESVWIRPKPPQPGLGLSILIMLGVLAVQAGSTLAYLLFVEPDLLAHAATGDLMEHLEPGQVVNLLGFTQAMFVLAAFVGTWLVFGKQFPRVIPFSLPRARHLAIIALLVVPLAVFDLYLVQQLITCKEAILGEPPSQGELPELLNGLTEGTSVWVLLAILAVAPALGEELVFRGVIGRGLVARDGFVVGIIWTSLFFSVVHLNETQIVGVFFVGVMCHVSYLATRSLAAPILLHFLNNSLAVMAMKGQAALAETQATAAEIAPLEISAWLALAAAVCVLALGCLLWRSRIEFRNAKGNVIPDEFPGVDRPESAVTRHCRSAGPAWIAFAGVSYLLFLAGVYLTMPS